MLVAACMALQIAIDNGYAAIILTQEKDAQLVAYLKSGESSADAGPRFEKSPAVRIDSPEGADLNRRCDNFKGPK